MLNSLNIVLLFIALLGVIILISKRWLFALRGFTQLGFFVASEIAFFCNKGLACSNCLLSFGLCPIGTGQRAAFIKTFPVYITLFFVIVIGIVFGSLSCGWICPVGFVQDVFRSSRFREFKIKNSLSIFRYFILALSILLVVLELRYNFLTRQGIGLFQETTIFVGMALLLLSIFIRRPLCRFLCPLGLLYGKLNKISLIRVKLNSNNCTNCKYCSRSCVMQLNPQSEVNGQLCVKCFNCGKVCRKN